MQRLKQLGSLAQLFQGADVVEIIDAFLANSVVAPDGGRIADALGAGLAAQFDADTVCERVHGA